MLAHHDFEGDPRCQRASVVCGEGAGLACHERQYEGLGGCFERRHPFVVAFVTDAVDRLSHDVAVAMLFVLQLWFATRNAVFLILPVAVVRSTLKQVMTPFRPKVFIAHGEAVAEYASPGFTKFHGGNTG